MTAGLIEFIRLTGCRPGEACTIRRSDIDTGGVIWLYRPTTHKTAWRERSRTIAIGPKAQELLKSFFTLNLDDFLFSPRRAMEQVLADRSANRRTPRYPSHQARNEQKRVSRPGRPPPRDRYTTTSLNRAVALGLAMPPFRPQEPSGEQRRNHTLNGWLG